MTKRNLFDELVEGFDALQDEREKKRTLRTYSIDDDMHSPAISADEIRALRERLHLSRPVLASMLRTNPRTLEPK